MIDLQCFHIDGVYKSNIYEEFHVYFSNLGDKIYEFKIRINLTNDTVFVNVDKLYYFDTLYTLIKHVLKILDVDRDGHNIKYQYTKSNFISFDSELEIMKVYYGGHTLADVYLQEDYIELYKPNKSIRRYEKSGNLFLLDHDNISILRTDDDLNTANKLLESCKSEILAGIKYFNFLTKR